MFLSLLELLWWLQPAASGTGGGGGGGGGAASDGGAAPGLGGCTGGDAMSQLPFIILMFVVFYFVLIRPQQKRQKEQDAMLKALRKGQVVRTSGGIRGEIFALTDTDVTLLVADKTKINVLRTHIGGQEGATSDTKED